MKKGLNIYKRKDGRYEGRYIKNHENDKAKYGYVYGKSYSETKEKLLNVNNTAISQKNQSMTIAKISDEWLKAVQIKTKISTYSKYHYTVTNHIKKDIGSISAENLTTSIVIDYTNTLLEKTVNGRKLATKTVRNILNIFSMVLNYYKKNYNPSLNIAVIYPKVETKPIDVLNNAEITALEHSICQKTDRRKVGILLTLYTGLRLGELCSLKWENINFDERYIAVKSTVQRVKNFGSNDGAKAKTRLITGTPKSKTSVRIVPLPDFIIPILSRYKSSLNSYFLSSTDRVTEPRTYQNYFKKLLKDSNVRNTNFHTLRHTFATRGINSGCDVKSLSELLGHSSVKTTLDLYVHPSFETKRANINKVAPFVFPIAL